MNKAAVASKPLEPSLITSDKSHSSENDIPSSSLKDAQVETINRCLIGIFFVKNIIRTYPFLVNNVYLITILNTVN